MGSDVLPRMNRVYINMYGAVGTFNSADYIFKHVIDPCVERFDVDDMKILIDVISRNDQTYNRARASEDHGRIKARCVFLGLRVEVDARMALVIVNE